MFWHPLIALLLTTLAGLTTGDWPAGAAMGAALFVGREHAQAEYRWIERFGQHLRANMPWWGGFDLRVWNVKSFTDWLGPLVAAALLCLIVGSA